MIRLVLLASCLSWLLGACANNDPSTTAPPARHGWSRLGDGLPGPVYALTTFRGQLVAMGHEILPGPDSLYVRRWDGASWQLLGRLFGGQPLVAHALGVYGDELYAAGRFDHVGSQEIHSIARWDGASWKPVGDGFQCTLESLYAYDGQLMVGGNWGDHLHQETRTGWRTWDGEGWHTPNSMHGTIRRFCEYRGRLLASWEYDFLGEDSTCVLQWTGSAWARVDSTRAMPYVVWGLAIYRGDLVVGGPFFMRDLGSAHYIARYDGSEWLPLGSGTDSAVYDMVVYNDDLVVVGDFAYAGDQLVHCIARWNGSSWQAFGDGYGLGFPGKCLTVWDGALIVGGPFRCAGSDADTVNYIARWDD